MKFLTPLFESDVEEGITKDGDNWKFDFSMDTKDDILNLKLRPYRGRRMKTDDMSYRYFQAYTIYKSDDSSDLMKSIKYIDSSISRRDLDQLVNKAILSFNKEFKISSYDTIIAPKSSSLILKELVDKVYKKSGASEVFTDAFVKAANTDITYDKEKVDNLPEKTRKEFLNALEKQKGKKETFKIRSIYAMQRKLVKDFLIFNSEDDKRLVNSVAGKKVILVDDYKTTGTTVKEMLRKLKDAGASEVVIFVLMKMDSKKTK